jgi:rhodanese-related sulfurtransferase
MSYQNGMGYAGDMLSIDACGVPADEATATLIDVRTQAEWTYAGAPDLSSSGKAALLPEWRSFPSMQLDERFAVRLSGMPITAGAKRRPPLVFICRSRVRSRHAAIAVTNAGWAPCLA